MLTLISARIIFIVYDLYIYIFQWNDSSLYTAGIFVVTFDNIFSLFFVICSCFIGLFMQKIINF